jgi:hypothetical protein
MSDNRLYIVHKPSGKSIKIVSTYYDYPMSLGKMVDVEGLEKFFAELDLNVDDLDGADFGVEFETGQKAV